MYEPPVNWNLKSLAEALKSQRAVSGSEGVCSRHGEKRKLFCLEDEEPICLVCQTSRQHISHSCVPVDEAAQDHREALKSTLKPLEEKLELLREVKDTCVQMAAHIKTQAVNTERQIKEDFKKLHQFLEEEEEGRIAVLKEEEQQKSERMKEKIKGLNRERTSLSETIKGIEEELRADDILLLQVSVTVTGLVYTSCPYPVHI